MNITNSATTPKDIIDNILSASKPEDVAVFIDFQDEYKRIAKEIHPDICSLPNADTAMAKMNHWKDYLENGKEYKDEVGLFRTNGYWVEFDSPEKNLQWSFENYKIFKSLKGETDLHFQNYLPKELDGNRLLFDKRAIPLSGITLPQEHVNWVLNRLLEYCAYLSEIGMAHCGLTPESVFIIPETHGIQICSFYHLTKFGNRIGTISGKYKNWYPQEVFATQTANNVIDVELSKKIAAYLLGAPSGNVVGLRKTHNEAFLNFLIEQHDKPTYQILSSYRELLKNNFKKRFHLLSI